MTAHRKPSKRLARRPPAGRGTILLIDDEASVRLPLRRALEHCGDRVLEATDGPHGLDIFARSGERIDLAVVDQRMPTMSGQQVLEELKRQEASLPVIMISGHRQSTGTGTTDDAPHADAFLRKPFELVDLARTVRRLTAAA